MRLCINAYAYMHQRRRVSGRQVRGGTDFPASKIAKTKNVPREANKLWGEKFSWIRERGGEGGEERREDGIKRNMEYEDGAVPTSSPCLFRTPFRWSVYIGESVWSRILAGLNYLFVPSIFIFAELFFIISFLFLHYQWSCWKEKLIENFFEPAKRKNK